MDCFEKQIKHSFDYLNKTFNIVLDKKNLSAIYFLNDSQIDDIFNMKMFYEKNVVSKSQGIYLIFQNDLPYEQNCAADQPSYSDAYFNTVAVHELAHKYEGAFDNEKSVINKSMLLAEGIPTYIHLEYFKLLKINPVISKNANCLYRNIDNNNADIDSVCRMVNAIELARQYVQTNGKGIIFSFRQRGILRPS